MNSFDLIRIVAGIFPGALVTQGHNNTSVTVVVQKDLNGMEDLEAETMLMLRQAHEAGPVSYFSVCTNRHKLSMAVIYSIPPEKEGGA